MRPLLSCAEASALDLGVQRRAQLPPAILMEDASVRLWDALEPIAAALGAGAAGTLTALCGSGNNAGDALAVLRHARFAGLNDMAVILGKSAPGELAMTQLSYLRALGIPVLSWEAEPDSCRALLGRSLLLVDGIAGTGLHGPLREPLASLLLAAVGSGSLVAAVDIPSGLSDDFSAGLSLLPARWTLAIEPRKAGLYFPAVRPACGKIVGVGGVFPVGEPAKTGFELLEPDDLRRLVARPAPSAYKGSRGRLAVFAGSVGATGAAAMCSRASLAAGAGLVALFVSAEILPILSSKLDAVMVKPAPSAPGAIEVERWDALLAGPGWGRSGDNKATLAGLLSTGLPAVLDADAIALYGALASEGFVARGPLILTPHPGELSLLGGMPAEEALANPAKLLPPLASHLAATIVFKSHCTWIAAPDGRMSVWDGMESGLGTAGSGDVLAGIAAGLLAGASVERAGAGERSYDAARAAVIAHGLSGRRARAKRGWFQAPDLIEEAALILGAPGETAP